MLFEIAEAVGEPDIFGLADKINLEHLIYWERWFRLKDEARTRASREEWYLADIRNILGGYYGNKTPLNNDARIKFEFLTESEKLQRRKAKINAQMQMLGVIKNGR